MNIVKISTGRTIQAVRRVENGSNFLDRGRGLSENRYLEWHVEFAHSKKQEQQSWQFSLCYIALQTHPTG